jgi:hypothetical protein
MTQKWRVVEPFHLYGEDSEISSLDHAKKIVKSNMYYLHAFTIALFVLHLANIFYAEEKLENYNYIILTLIFGFMSFLTYKFMSRTASVILFFISIMAVLIISYLGIFGMRFLFAAIVSMAAFRCIKATIYYQKNIKIMRN